MYEKAKAKLEEQDLKLGQLKEIAVSVGVKNSHLMKTKEKVIDAISLIVVATESPLEVLVYEAPESTDSSQKTAEKKPKLIKQFPRERVIVYPLAEADSTIKENVFSINEYTINVIFGEEINIPKPMITHIKSLTTSSNKLINGKPVPIEVPRFSVSNV